MMQLWLSQTERQQLEQVMTDISVSSHQTTEGQGSGKMSWLPTATPAPYRDHWVVSPWPLSRWYPSSVSTLSLWPQIKAASTMGLSISIYSREWWRGGLGGGCPLLSSTTRMGSFVSIISIQYIFMLVSYPTAASLTSPARDLAVHSLQHFSSMAFHVTTEWLVSNYNSRFHGHHCQCSKTMRF